jgi:hypothetical protein
LCHHLLVRSHYLRRPQTLVLLVLSGKRAAPGDGSSEAQLRYRAARAFRQVART